MKTQEQLDHDQAEQELNLYTIATVKAYAYCEEYNPYTGKTEPTHGANFLKQGYVDGFLAGFEHKLTGGSHD